MSCPPAQDVGAVSQERVETEAASDSALAAAVEMMAAGGAPAVASAA